MKQYINKVLLLLTVSLVAILSSCEKEDALLQQQSISKEEYRVKEYTFKQVNQKPRFRNAFNKVNNGIQNLKNANKLNTPIHDIDFTIDSTTVKEITLNSKTTYTMFIHRVQSSENYFENLIVEVTSSASIRAYIIKYSPDREMVYQEAHKSFSFHGTSEIHEIHYDSSIFNPQSLVDDGECSMKLVCDWSTVEHAASAICCQTYWVIDCPGGGAPDGPGGTGSDGSNPVGTGPGGSSGGGGTNPNPIDPNNLPANYGEPVPTSPVYFPSSSINLTWALTLTSTQSAWINHTSQAAVKLALQQYLSVNSSSAESKAFSQQLLDLLRLESNIDNNALQFLLKALSQNKIKTELDDNFLLSLDSSIDADLSNVYNIDPIRVHFSIQCAVLRANHPTWSDAAIYWEAIKDVVHVTLDVFGLVPVVGEVADLTNGLLYTIEGDGINATLSVASAVPVLGWAAVSTKYAIKVTTTLTGTTKLVWKLVGNVISFGDRRQLRKVLNLAVGNPLIAHHIIPWAKQGHVVIQKAAKSGNAFHMNEALNGIPLSTTVHNGSHGHYDDLIFQKLEEFRILNPNATPNQCYNALMDIINDVRTAILNHPNTPINQLNF